MCVVQLFASMLPLLIKDHLMIAFVALIVIFYLVADICLSRVDTVTVTSVNADSSCSRHTHTSTTWLHRNKTLSLMVCNSSCQLCM